ncbi:MAG: hypothetical protein ACR2HF_15555 [Methylococcaceae bacterium]
MSSHENIVRSAVLNYFRQQSISEDHVLDLKHFWDTCMTDWTHDQKHQLEPTLVSLIREGILTKQNGYIMLTQEGFRNIYIQF